MLPQFHERRSGSPARLGRAIGRMAGDHLIDRGFRSLGDCGFSDQQWSRLRREGFVERAA